MMNKHELELRPYQSSDCDQVNNLIREIQLNEFGFSENDFPQPELRDIAHRYQKAGEFWVMLMNDKIIGTCALQNLGKGVAKLGKMFVDVEHRGRPLSIAQKLLDNTFSWALSNGVRLICFETIVEQCAAHTFYLRNGFKEVSSTDLPEVFKLCPYPSRYFMKEIK